MKINNIEEKQYREGEEHLKHENISKTDNKLVNLTKVGGKA